MKVALWATGPIGIRAARVLVAEPSVEKVAFVSGSAPTPAGYPTIRLSDLASWDVLVTDGPAPEDPPLPVVTSTDASPRPAHRSVAAADFVSGIGGSLLALEMERIGKPHQIVFAYTTRGPALHRGERLRFPTPVGSLHTRPTPGPALPPGVGRVLEAPAPDPWSGILLRLPGAESAVRVIGVADDRLFLEAIALASAAVAAGKGAYPEGPAFAYEAPAAFLEAAVGSGLTVASYSS